MYITTQNSLLQKYKATVVNITPLQEWKFLVEYYDDEGYLNKTIVDAQDLEE
jgi:hypothetical protein